MMCVFPRLNSYFLRILTAVTKLSQLLYLSHMKGVGCPDLLGLVMQCTDIGLCCLGPLSTWTFYVLGEAKAGYGRHTACILYYF